MALGTGAIAAALGKLAGVPSRAVKAAGAAIDARWKADWRAGKDPHGRAWRPLAPYTVRKRGSARPILIHTGAMIAGAAVTAAAKTGLRLTLSVPYAGFHQSGTARMPARPIIPYMGIPRSWESLIRKAIKDAYTAK